MKRSKTNSRRIKRLERKTASGSTIVNAFLGSSSGSGGVSSFLELSDTPTSYTGESLKAVRVNVGETALEFYTPSSGGLTGLGTTNEIAYFTGATSLASLTTATYPSLTELSYVKGVTSSIQTQFTGKLNTGLAWLLASGGTLTATNTLSGSFGIGFGATPNANGKIRVRGLGTTTGELLLCEDSTPTTRMVLTDAGNLTVSTGSITAFLTSGFALSSSAWSLFQSGTSVRYRSTNYASPHYFTTSASLGTAATNFNGITADFTFNPNSGAGTYNTFNAIPTINQSGTASGNVAGYSYTPTVTALLGSAHRAFYHTSGFVAWESVLSPAQITSNQNDYNPTGWNNGGAPNGASILRLSTDASRDLTGLTGGVSGRLVIISNVGSQDLVIKDESASSTAANRFALNNDITLFPDESLMFWYDSTSSRWRPCIKHKTGSTAYTPTNVTTDRSYDANATTLDELADVVGTLIADLQTLKILS